jgi:hypothetical protein
MTYSSLRSNLYKILQSRHLSNFMSRLALFKGTNTYETSFSPSGPSTTCNASSNLPWKKVKQIMNKKHWFSSWTSCTVQVNSSTNKPNWNLHMTTKLFSHHTPSKTWRKEPSLWHFCQWVFFLLRKSAWTVSQTSIHHIDDRTIGLFEIVKHTCNIYCSIHIYAIS